MTTMITTTSSSARKRMRRVGHSALWTTAKEIPQLRTKKKTRTNANSQNELFQLRAEPRVKRRPSVAAPPTSPSRTAVDRPSFSRSRWAAKRLVRGCKLGVTLHVCGAPHGRGDTSIQAERRRQSSGKQLYNFNLYIRTHTGDTVS